MGILRIDLYRKLLDVFNIFRKAKPVGLNGNLIKLTELTDKLISMERERDRLFEELKFREQAWNNLMLAMFDWAWITDENGRYSYVSPKSREIYGYSNGDMLGKMPHEFLEGQYREDVIKLEQYLIEAHEPLMNYESESRKADGTKIRTTTSCVPYFKSDGSYGGHIGVEKLVAPIFPGN